MTPREYELPDGTIARLGREPTQQEWDEAWAIFAKARENADMGEDEAVEFALREVRTVRHERARREARRQ